MKRLMLLIFLIPVACAVASAQLNCTTVGISGTYIVSYSGYIGMTQQGAPPPVYATIFGVVSVWYDGSIWGGATTTVLGLPATDYVVLGKVQVNHNCTGTINLKPYPKGYPELAENEVDRFVFDPHSKTIRLTIADIGPGFTVAALGSWEQIAPVPNAATW